MSQHTQQRTQSLRLGIPTAQGPTQQVPLVVHSALIGSVCAQHFLTRFPMTPEGGWQPPVHTCDCQCLQTAWVSSSLPAAGDTSRPYAAAYFRRLLACHMLPVSSVLQHSRVLTRKAPGCEQRPRDASGTLHCQPRRVGRSVEGRPHLQFRGQHRLCGQHLQLASPAPVRKRHSHTGTSSSVISPSRGPALAS